MKIAIAALDAAATSTELPIEAELRNRKYRYVESRGEG
jgi:hypothetical protein